MLFSYYTAKAKQEAEAYELATSTFKILNNGQVLPWAEDDGVPVLKRISGLTTSVGSKILNRKLDGVVGSIVVNGSDSAKSILSEYNLSTLTEKLARDMIAKGSAGLAVGNDPDGKPYVYRLGGFISRITEEYDVDSTVGILQAQQNDDNKWQVRRYDIDGTVSEWSNLSAFQDVTRNKPTNVYTNPAHVAFFADYQTDDAGMSIGEIEQLAPLLKGILAVEARIHRVSEIFGFPRAVISGALQESKNSPDSALIISEGGSVRYLTPADMSGLINQKRDLLKQLDDVAIMPAGQALGYEPPSGQAIQEANQAFNNNLWRYGNNISTLLTDAFTALLKSMNVDTTDFSVTLYPNLVENEIDKLNLMIGQLEKGLLPISFVVRQLQSVYVDMTPEEAQEVIETWTSRKASITPADLGL